MTSVYLALLLTTFANSAPAPEIRPQTRGCDQAFAQIKTPYKKILASAAGAHAVGLGALVALQPKPVVKEAPKPTRSEIEKYFSDDEFPASRLLSREEIIKRAQAFLNAEKNRENPGFPLGELLIQSEISQKQPPDMALLTNSLRRYKRDQVVLKKIQNQSGLKQFEKIEKAVEYLHRSYFRHYCRDIGNVSNFFSKQNCGNCQSNTKLVIAELEDAGIYAPEGFEIAAQLYNDHIAPVIIEKKTNEVRDLVTNKEQAAPDAPVYKKTLLLHALLTHMKEVLEIDLPELLIAKSDAPQTENSSVAFAGEIDSNTSFSGGSGSFGGGQPIPETADMARGKMGDGMLGREGVPTRYKERVDYTKFKLVVENDKSTKEYDLSADPDKKIISASPEIAELCKSELSTITSESYMRCQDKRVHARIDKALSTPTGKLLGAFALHPNKANSFSAPDLRAMADLIDGIGKSIREARTFNLTRTDQMTVHPGIDKIFDMVRNLDEKLETDPVMFMNFLDGLPKDKRVSVGRILSRVPFREMYPFLNEASKYPDDSENKGYKALRTLLVNDDEMSLYLPRTTLGPRDTIMYLDGDMKSGYTGYIQKPQGQSESLISAKEKDKTPGGSKGNSAEHGGIDEEIPTKLRLAPATVAALIPFLPSMQEDPSDYVNYPDGRAGAGKYFTPAVAQAFAESTNSDDAFERYQLLAKQYFDNLDIRDISEAAPNFFKLFGKEKFFYPGIFSDYGGESFGLFPEMLAKIVINKHKERSKREATESISEEYSMRPYEEPIMREQDMPQEEQPEDAPLPEEN